MVAFEVDLVEVTESTLEFFGFALNRLLRLRAKIFKIKRRVQAAQKVLRFHNILVDSLVAFGVLCVVWIFLANELLLSLIELQVVSYIFFDRIQIKIPKPILILLRRLMHGPLQIPGIIQVPIQRLIVSPNIVNIRWRTRLPVIKLMYNLLLHFLIGVVKFHHGVCGCLPLFLILFILN